jgi:hypothetical protein
MGPGNVILDARELRANTRDEVKAYTFADLNGEPFKAYYCAQSLGLSSYDWEEMQKTR